MKISQFYYYYGDSVENEYYKADRKQVHGLRIYVVPQRERPINKVSQLR